MANGHPRRSSIFTGLVLILFGFLFLLHNYRGGFSVGRLLLHWWPLLLILWGVAKLYERVAAQRSGVKPAAPIRAGEVFLILALLCLVGLVALADFVKERAPGLGIEVEEPVFGDSHTFDIDVASKTVPANAHILIHIGRGDIRVRAGDTPEVRVSGKRTVRAWTESEAQRIADSARLEIVQNGDAYEVRMPGGDTSSSRAAVDLDVVVPKKAPLTIRKEKGNVEVSDAGGELSIATQGGDVEVRGARADVDVEMRRGSVKISDTKGDVKISGRGGEVEVVKAAGGLTLDGEFRGPIRAEKIAKGVRFVSSRTDLTLTQLSGHLETGSGNLQVFDSAGNLTLRTRDYDLDLENVTGKIKVDNRSGNIQVRFPSPPKENIEITNSSAGITLTLPASSSFELFADSRSGEIDSEFDAPSIKKTTSQSGDSHLEGKVGSRGPKITLKTSYGQISIHKSG